MTEKISSDGNYDESLNFGGGEPGASRHGNFINYYKFHPAEERVEQLPRGVWQSCYSDRKFIALDVGCNAGDLTISLWNFLQSQLPDDSVRTLGVDLDPILINRACEKNTNSFIEFSCLDFITEKREKIISEYLKKFERLKFDVVFCFSITMWIHLNHGDEGLVKFLENVCGICDMLVIEPQPWKCYRQASRRLRKSGMADFPLINSLKMTGSMEKWVEEIITGDKCGFKRIIVTADNTWGRKILIFKRNNN